MRGRGISGRSTKPAHVCQQKESGQAWWVEGGRADSMFALPTPPRPAALHRRPLPAALQEAHTEAAAASPSPSPPPVKGPSQLTTDAAGSKKTAAAAPKAKGPTPSPPAGRAPPVLQRAKQQQSEPDAGTGELGSRGGAPIHCGVAAGPQPAASRQGWPAHARQPLLPPHLSARLQPRQPGSSHSWWRSTSATPAQRPHRTRAAGRARRAKQAKRSCAEAAWWHPTWC